MKVSKDAILVILLCTICYKWGELDVMDRVRMLYRLLLLSYDSYRVYMHTTLERPQVSVVVVIVHSLPVFQTPTRKPVSQQFAHLTRAILSTVRDTCQSILNNNNNSYVSYKQGNVMSSWRPQASSKTVCFCMVQVLSLGLRCMQCRSSLMLESVLTFSVALLSVFNSLQSKPLCKNDRGCRH